MKVHLFTLIFLPASLLFGAQSEVQVKEDKENLYVSYSSGHGYHYSKGEFGVQTVWSGAADKAQAKDLYKVHVMKKPWQTKLRSLDMEWGGHKVIDDNVVFSYKVKDKALGADYDIQEKITLSSDSIILDFSLKRNGNSIPLNYRMYQDFHKQVRTNGQPRGRSQVLYLKPDQKEYRITVVKQNNSRQLPAGYSLSRVNTPKLEDRQFEPTGFAFTDDDTLYVTTRAAGMWSYKDGQWLLFADGLYEPLGVEQYKGELYVMQKPELTRVSDTDKDGVADSYRTLSYKYRFTGDFHSYAHGPLVDSVGDFYFATNLPARESSGVTVTQTDGLQMTTPKGYRGWVLKAGKDGEVVPFASGFRTPSGTCINEKDEIFITDNQGDWVGSSYLIHVQEGGFHGHPASLLDLAEYGGKKVNYTNLDTKDIELPAGLDVKQMTANRVLPTVWLPHNEYSNSPGSPVFNTSDKFGPFKGQMFVGDFTKRNIMRIHLEKVGGAYQGAVFHFARPLDCGAHRIKFDKQGQLWIGEISRGWATGDPGIQVLKWDGKTMPYEMHSIQLQKDGFDISMTKSIAREVVSLDDIELVSYKYHYWANYGSEMVDVRTEKVSAITLSEDQKTISLQCPLERERIYSFRLKNLPSVDGDTLVNDTACYTLNNLVSKK